MAAVTIVTEVGELSRFAKARQLMGYSGGVAREDSTGERIRRRARRAGAGERVRYRRSVHPGDAVDIEARVLRLRGRLGLPTGQRALTAKSRWTARDDVRARAQTTIERKRPPSTLVLGCSPEQLGSRFISRVKPLIR